MSCWFFCTVYDHACVKDIKIMIKCGEFVFCNGICCKLFLIVDIVVVCLCVRIHSTRCFVMEFLLTCSFSFGISYRFLYRSNIDRKINLFFQAMNHYFLKGVHLFQETMIRCWWFQSRKIDLYIHNVTVCMVCENGMNSPTCRFVW